MVKIFKKNKYNAWFTGGQGGPASTQGGVTLVELMVVIVIFLIMSMVVLFNYSQLRSSTSIQNLADDIALSIRKAQSYAIGVRGSNNSFGYSYGVHLTASVSLDPYAGSNKSFVLFTNVNDNKIYDYTSNLGTCGTPSASNECLEVLNITSGDQISEIYINDEDTNPNPVSTNGDTGVVNIFFKRPNPEPTFCIRSDNGNINPQDCISDTSISHIRIKISNISDPTSYKWITIWNNGQISVS
jgi:prepilin-type N-terminal cleavage/methylation domain-containing protein